MALADWCTRADACAHCTTRSANSRLYPPQMLLSLVIPLLRIVLINTGVRLGTHLTRAG
jgi:hypothetical protein